MSESENNKVNKRPGSFLLIYLLGVATVIGGQVSYWNEGLIHGFWPLLGSFLLMLSGYVCLALCLCEMTAALPFSGGTYGLARVTLGQFAGYLMASFEMVEYVIYVVLIAHSIGEMITEITGGHREYEPVTWILFYLTGFVFQLSKPTIMWSFIAFFGACVLIFMAVFIVGSPGPAHANFSRYAVDHTSNNETASQFMMSWFKCLPFSSWFFLGIETLPIASGDIIQANRTIPRAIILLLVTVVCTAIPLVFTASSIFPGAISSVFQDSKMPLNYGFEAMLGITHHQAIISTVIVKYITGFGFMFAYGRQMSAMQLSGLILSQLRLTLGDKHSLRRGLIAAGIVSLFFLAATWLFNNNFFKHYHSACLLGNYLVCLGLFISYIQFRAKYDSLAKTHRSALGVCGAVYGIMVFTIAFVSLAGFQDDDGMALLSLALFTGYMLARYLLFNMGKPVISTEEQSVLFVLYVINANMSRKRVINERAALSRARDHVDSDSAIVRTVSMQHSPQNTYKRNTFRGSLNFYLSGSPRFHSQSQDDTSAPSTRNPSYRTAATNSDKQEKHSGRLSTAQTDAQTHTSDTVTYFHELENDLLFENQLSHSPTVRRSSSGTRGFQRRLSGEFPVLFDVEEEDSGSTHGSSLRLVRKSFSESPPGEQVVPLSAGKTRRGSSGRKGVMDLLTSPKPAVPRKLSAGDYNALNCSSDSTLVEGRQGMEGLTPDTLDMTCSGRPNRPSLRSFSGADALIRIDEGDMGKQPGDRPHSHRMKPQAATSQTSLLDRFRVGSDSPDIHDGVIVSGPQSLSVDTRLPFTDRQHQLLQQSPPPLVNTRAHSSRFKAFNQRVFGNNNFIKGGNAPFSGPVSSGPTPQQRARTISMDANIMDTYKEELMEYYSHNHEALGNEDGI